MIKKILLAGTLSLMLVGCEDALKVSPPPSAPTDVTAAVPEPASRSALVWPLVNAAERITKKHFGTKVSPKNSPIQPEKFSGYHTGTDFETTPEEQTADVSVSAICDGKILVKKRATGYGGVLVQACTLDGSAITVVYGHLKLTSIKETAGDSLTAGQPFAFLGAPYSTETDGERKHLHLGIHVGNVVNILGYVQKESELARWLDFQKIMAPHLSSKKNTTAAAMR